MSITAWNDPAGGVKVALPISVRPLESFLDMTGDTSPFATMTHDGGVPETYGRRMWALCCGLSDAEVAKVHQQAGVIGLDRYKNWILNWPYDSSKTFPRSQTTPALADTLKKSLDSHPEKDKLQTCYVITGNAQDAINNANAALAQLRQPQRIHQQLGKELGVRQLIATAISRTGSSAPRTPCPARRLPSGLRDELRQRLALFAYWLIDPT